IKEILQDYKYEIKEDQIFIFSKDYDYLHRQLFTHLLNIDYGYYEKWPIINYDIYVIKDEDLFNDLITSTFDYRGVAGKANNIKNAYGYAREFMEIEKSDDYKYVFFRYSSNGCSGCMNGCSCSIVYGMN
ncbi:MAG: hypothetical protein K2M17_02925, partial [Bacilli bacterium]|nr:hypothetical protein [Bacilli bacterium]